MDHKDSEAKKQNGCCACKSNPCKCCRCGKNCKCEKCNGYKCTGECKCISGRCSSFNNQQEGSSGEH